MSGGVDSSTAAYLLHQQGYEIIGVHLVEWETPAEWEIAVAKKNPRRHASHQAKVVADFLGIKLLTLDIAEIYRKKIVEPFVEQYLQGKTPNPCAVCNDEIKLSILLEKAKELNASGVATGHYARIEYDEGAERYFLRRGIDRDKDQSYYLGRVKKGKLPFFKTPLGNQTKETTRRIAREAGLPVAQTTESQDVCFILERDYRQFLLNYARFVLGKSIIEPGPIYDTEGNLIGQHKGLPFYTIGQRKGLRISSPHPLYVVEIDPKQNALIVGEKDKVFARGLIGEEANWVSIEPPAGEIEAEVQIRFRHSPAPACLRPIDNNLVEVNFSQPQPAVTPGQLAVFYQGDILLSSAFINKVIK